MTSALATQNAGGAFKVANLGAGEMRSDVSTEWFRRPADERYLTLSALAAYKRKEYGESTEARHNNRDIEVLAPETVNSVEDTHRLWYGLPDGTEVGSTAWCFQQLCSLAKAPASYLKTLPTQIVRDNINYSLRFNREVESVKTFHHTNGKSIMRAITGPDYGRIPDYEIVEAVQQVAGEGTGDARWKIPGVMSWSTGIYDPHTPVTKDTTTLFASDRDIFIFLVDDLHPIKVGTVTDPRTGRVEDDLMFRGFYLTNSEVGKSSLKLAAFYLRGICMNRCLWGVEGFEELTIRHTKFAPDRFLLEAEPALKSFGDGSSQRLLEGVQKAKAAKVASNDEAAIAFLNGRGLSSAKAKKVLETVEAEEGTKLRSAWDAAQGITAVARSERNQDNRIQLETIAGRILDKAAA